MKVTSTMITAIFASIASLLVLSPMTNMKFALSNKLFLPNLVGTPPCELKSYHLGPNSPFPTLKPALELFWESSFAPVCKDKVPYTTILVDWFMSYRETLVPNELLQPFACGLKDYHLGEDAPFPMFKPALKLYYESSFAPICEKKSFYSPLVDWFVALVPKLTLSDALEMLENLVWELKMAFVHLKESFLVLCTEVNNHYYYFYGPQMTNATWTAVVDIKNTIWSALIKITNSIWTAMMENESQSGHQVPQKEHAEHPMVSLLVNFIMSFTSVYFAPDFVKWYQGRNSGESHSQEDANNHGPPNLMKYKILGVLNTATTAEIKKAYRREALWAHPDKGGSNELFREIHLAYEILVDMDTRKRYDIYGEAGLEPHQQSLQW